MALTFNDSDRKFWLNAVASMATPIVGISARFITLSGDVVNFAVGFRDFDNLDVLGSLRWFGLRFYFLLRLLFRQAGTDLVQIIYSLRIRGHASMFGYGAFAGVVSGQRQPVVAFVQVDQITQVARSSLHI